jgi:Tfp pilus assembly protein PilF
MTGTMRRLLALMLIGMLGLPAFCRSDDADDVYIRIYHLIEQADTLKQNGQSQSAYEKYDQAREALNRMQSTYPQWNNRLVEYRINYVRQKLAQLPPPAAKPSPQPTAAAAAKPTSPEIPVEKAAPPPNLELQSQVQELTRQVKQLESDKKALDAKLRESLSAQPATVDPRELAKAQARIISLQKENDLMRVTLDQEKLRATKLVDPEKLAKTQKTLDEAQRRLNEQVQLVTSLNQEKKVLESKVRAKADAKAASSARPDDAQLRRLTQEVADQKRRIAELEREKEQFKKTATQPAPVQTSSTRAERRAANKRLHAELDQRQSEIETLRSEKRAVEKQLSLARNQQEQDLTRSEKRALAEQRKKNQELDSQNRALEKQTAALKQKVVELESSNEKATRAAASAAKTPAPKVEAVDDSKRMLALERERDELQRKLDQALRNINNSKSKADSERFLQMSNQLATLQARLATLEAAKVPYSAEELALMKVPLIVVSNTNPPTVTTNVATKPSVSELPGGAAPLLAEAQRAFASGQLDVAEQKYLKVLSLDDKSVVTIGNLAAIQIEQKKFTEAEANLKKALELDPNDAYNLQLLGILRFRQDRFDEALTALSQSARLDPKNAETQNYLGITLSEKGFRDAAEAALRRSIQLSPDYANAHHNLAVIYATQNPPFLELARWHYQKALSGGHARNLDMEKVLSPTRAPEESKP